MVTWEQKSVNREAGTGEQNKGETGTNGGGLEMGQK